MKAPVTGSMADVSAVLPLEGATISGNPAWWVSRPIVICGPGGVPWRTPLSRNPTPAPRRRAGCADGRAGRTGHCQAPRAGRSSTAAAAPRCPAGAGGQLRRAGAARWSARLAPFSGRDSGWCPVSRSMRMVSRFVPMIRTTARFRARPRLGHHPQPPPPTRQRADRHRRNPAAPLGGRRRPYQQPDPPPLTKMKISLPYFKSL